MGAFFHQILLEEISRNEMNGLPYKNIKCDYVPHVAYVYPENNSQDLNDGHSSEIDCPDLFIPDFTRAKAFIESDRWLGSEEFTLTLTDESGKRTFAYCVRHLIRQHEMNREQRACSKEGDLPEVFAIISPIHAPLFYLELVRECVCYLHGSLDKLKNFLSVVYRCTFPIDGSSLHVFEKVKDGTKRNVIIRGQGPILGQSGCSAFVQRMGLEVTVAVIGALLAEQRVIIAGGSVQCVCHAVQSVACLLHPFSWPYTLVPVLPDSLLEIVNSPTPYLMGLLRTNMYKLKSLFVKDKNRCADDLIQDDLVIVDLDGGIFVPQLIKLCAKNESIDFKAKNAFALCEKLLILRKLAVSLTTKLKEAVAVDEGPRADFLLQKAMLSWFAALIWPYKDCSFYAALIAESSGDFESIRTSKAQLVASHTSKSARRFTEWFGETGIFLEWIRRKVTSDPEMTNTIPHIAEDVANQKFDDCIIAATSQVFQTRVANIFTKAHNFRSHLLKKL